MKKLKSCPLLLLLLLLTGCCLSHRWEEATCLAPKTCSKCGETEGEALGHDWQSANCTAPMTCARCGETKGRAAGHNWLDATCEEPKTCAECALTEGEPNGHIWADATCQTAKTCYVCGKTEGSPLEHNWVDATCVQPKHCKDCGEEEGEALGHDWQEATCATPKTCSRCGQVAEGKEKIDHFWEGDYCQVCGAPKEPIACGDWYYYTQNDGTAEIIGYVGNKKTISIPEEVDGRTVTAISNWALSYTTITSVTIPDCLTRWEGDILYLNSAEIHVSQEHTTLAVIDGVLFDKVSKTLLYYPCEKKDTSYAIPQGIREIGEDAFANCAYLQELEIPDSVTTIGDYAFINANKLNVITIPNSVSTIGENPFRGYQLTVRIAEDHPYFKMVDGVLLDRDMTRVIHCPENRQSSSYVIPDGVEKLDDGAFRWCGYLKEVSIPSSVKSLGGDCFQASGLTSVVIPDGVEVIPEECFHWCTQLREVTLPDTVTSIGDVAFYHCDSLTKINLPQGLTSIGQMAFSNCGQLKELTIPASVTWIEEDAFAGCNQLTINVERGSFAAQYCRDNNLNYQYADAFDWLNEE